MPGAKLLTFTKVRTRFLDIPCNYTHKEKEYNKLNGKRKRKKRCYDNGNRQKTRLEILYY